MNENCQLLELNNTQFTTVSGLNDKQNYSTAQDDTEEIRKSNRNKKMRIEDSDEEKPEVEQEIC